MTVSKTGAKAAAAAKKAGAVKQQRKSAKPQWAVRSERKLLDKNARKAKARAIRQQAATLVGIMLVGVM